MNLQSRDRAKAALGELESLLYRWEEKWIPDPEPGDALLPALDGLHDVKTLADTIRQEIL